MAPCAFRGSRWRNWAVVWLDKRVFSRSNPASCGCGNGQHCHRGSFGGEISSFRHGKDQGWVDARSHRIFARTPGHGDGIHQKRFVTRPAKVADKSKSQGSIPG